jgi:hypothetical protein
MAISSRAELIEYCLRSLGHPVITINVEEGQCNDRIDEAFAFFQEYHEDAMQKVYLKHPITDTDKTNGYISVDDSIIGVTNILPISTNFSSSLFSPIFQLTIQDFYMFQPFDVENYLHLRQRIRDIEMIFVGEKMIRYARHQNRLYVDMDWTKVNTGDYIIAEAYAIVDPDEFTRIYNDRWLKKYSTALIKKQWGNNLKKYNGMALPGGITMNGQQIYEEAVAELDKIESEIQSHFEAPPSMFIG